MLENTSSRGKASPSEQRQVKALLRLVQDLGFEVETGASGDWVVSERSASGARTIIGVDSARKVAAVASQLADSLQIDRKLVENGTLA